MWLKYITVKFQHVLPQTQVCQRLAKDALMPVPKIGPGFFIQVVFK